MPHRQLTILACVQESVAALISVAFEYPNTLISLVFHEAFQCSFVEDIEVLRARATFPSNQLNALHQTVLSCHSHGLKSTKSIENHALFQTLLTPIDVDVMRRYQVDYLDVFTCDRCLLEVLRLLILDMCTCEQILPDDMWPTSNLVSPGAIGSRFLSYLLRGKYKKLKPYLNELGLENIQRSSLIYIEYLCHIVIRRSAQILSSLIVGLSDRRNEENITVAMDSDLYRVCPIYQVYMQREIESLCKRWITTFHFVNATHTSYVTL